MNSLKNIKFYFFSAMSMTLMLSCSDPEVPEIINQEELITTAKVELTPENGGQPIILSYQDLDGDGPTEPIVVNGILTANTSYSGEITLLNETLSPPENITEEVEEEALDHQFFYSNTANLTFVYTDFDDNGNPVGIMFNLQTAAPTSGSMTITLRHEPDKYGIGVNEGQIENAGGETDISVTFGIEVQ